MGRLYDPSDRIQYFATVIGGADAARTVTESSAAVGFESANAEPPDNVSVEFIDWPFSKIDDKDEAELWDRHLELVKEYEPQLTVAPDLEGDTELTDVLDHAEQLDQYADQVVVVPKENAHPTDIPDKWRVGIPLANFGSDAPWEIHEFLEVEAAHLLGGSPTVQRRVATTHIPVASADSASVFKGAANYDVWTWPGEYHRMWQEAPETDYYDRIQAGLDNTVAALNGTPIADEMPITLAEKYEPEPLVDEYHPRGPPMCQSPDCDNISVAETNYTYCKACATREGGAYLPEHIPVEIAEQWAEDPNAEDREAVEEIDRQLTLSDAENRDPTAADGGTTTSMSTDPYDPTVEAPTTDEVEAAVPEQDKPELFDPPEDSEIEPDDSITEITGIGDATAEEIPVETVGEFIEAGFPLAYVDSQYVLGGVESVLGMDAVDPSDPTTVIGVHTGVTNAALYDADGEHVAGLPSLVLNQADLDRLSWSWSEHWHYKPEDEDDDPSGLRSPIPQHTALGAGRFVPEHLIDVSEFEDQSAVVDWGNPDEIGEFSMHSEQTGVGFSREGEHRAEVKIETVEYINTLFGTDYADEAAADLIWTAGVSRTEGRSGNVVVFDHPDAAVFAAVVTDTAKGYDPIVQPEDFSRVPPAPEPDDEETEEEADDDTASVDSPPREINGWNHHGMFARHNDAPVYTSPPWVLQVIQESASYWSVWLRRSDQLGSEMMDHDAIDSMEVVEEFAKGKLTERQAFEEAVEWMESTPPEDLEATSSGEDSARNVPIPDDAPGDWYLNQRDTHSIEWRRETDDTNVEGTPIHEIVTVEPSDIGDYTRASGLYIGPADKNVHQLRHHKTIATGDTYGEVADETLDWMEDYVERNSDPQDTDDEADASMENLADEFYGWELTDEGGANTYSFKHRNGQRVVIEQRGDGWDADLHNPDWPDHTKWLTDADARDQQPGRGTGDRERDTVDLEAAVSAAYDEMARIYRETEHDEDTEADESTDGGAMGEDEFTAALHDLADDYEGWRVEREPPEDDGFEWANGRGYAKLEYHEDKGSSGLTGSKYHAGDVTIKTHDQGDRTYQTHVRIYAGANRSNIHSGEDVSTSTSLYDDELVNGSRREVVEELRSFFEHGETVDDGGSEWFHQTDESGDVYDPTGEFGFDEYGPTMDHPIPEEEQQTLPGSEPLDKRELEDTGLAPSDFEIVSGVAHPDTIADQGYHPDDRERETHEEAWEDMMGEVYDPTAGEIEANVQAAEAAGVYDPTDEYDELPEEINGWTLTNGLESNTTYSGDLPEPSEYETDTGTSHTAWSVTAKATSTISGYQVTASDGMRSYQLAHPNEYGEAIPPLVEFVHEHTPDEAHELILSEDRGPGWESHPANEDDEPEDARPPEKQLQQDAGIATSRAGTLLSEYGDLTELATATVQAGESITDHDGIGSKTRESVHEWALDYLEAADTPDEAPGNWERASDSEYLTHYVDGDEGLAFRKSGQKDVYYPMAWADGSKKADPTTELPTDEFEVADLDRIAHEYMRNAPVADASDWIGHVGGKLDAADGDGEPISSDDGDDETAAAETIVFIGCGDAKHDGTHKAKNLYSSTYFEKKRDYAEAVGDRWYILSAKHAVVDPDEEIESYDMGLDKSDRDWWGKEAKTELNKLGFEDGYDPSGVAFDGARVEVLAGEDYISPLESWLDNATTEWDAPTRGMMIGERMQWLGENTSEQDEADESAEESANLYAADENDYDETGYPDAPDSVGPFHRHEAPPGRYKWATNNGPHVTVVVQKGGVNNTWSFQAVKDGDRIMSGSGMDAFAAVEQAVEWMEGYDHDTDDGETNEHREADRQALMAVEGIGPKRADALLDAFGDLGTVSRKASSHTMALSEVEGFTLSTAKDLFDKMRDADVYASGAGSVGRSISEIHAEYADDSDDDSADGSDDYSEYPSYACADCDNEVANSPQYPGDCLYCGSDMEVTDPGEPEDESTPTIFKAERDRWPLLTPYAHKTTKVDDLPGIGRTTAEKFRGIQTDLLVNIGDLAYHVANPNENHDQTWIDAHADKIYQMGDALPSEGAVDTFIEAIEQVAEQSGRAPDAPLATDLIRQGYSGEEPTEYTAVISDDETDTPDGDDLPDDLTDITGIGPATADALADEGIEAPDDLGEAFEDPDSWQTIQVTALSGLPPQYQDDVAKAAGRLAATDGVPSDQAAAERVHSVRSAEAQEMDESIQAREQTTSFAQWIQAPHMQDFVGIDDLASGLGINIGDLFDAAPDEGQIRASESNNGGVAIPAADGGTYDPVAEFEGGDQ